MSDGRASSTLPVSAFLCRYGLTAGSRQLPKAHAVHSTNWSNPWPNQVSAPANWYCKQWGTKGRTVPSSRLPWPNCQRPMRGEGAHSAVSSNGRWARARNQKSTNRAHLHSGPYTPGTLHWQHTSAQQWESEGPPLHSFSPTQTALPDNPSQHHHHHRRRYPNLTFSISPRATGPPSWTSLLSFVYCPSSVSRPDPTTTSSNLQNA